MSSKEPKKLKQLSKKLKAKLNRSNPPQQSQKPQQQPLRHQRRWQVQSQEQELLLQKLSLPQLEEALMCLYQDSPPQDKLLRELKAQEWSLLQFLLNLLMYEKKSSSLH